MQTLRREAMEMVSMSEHPTSHSLLPCPFCGTAARVCVDDDYGAYVACDSPVCFAAMGERTASDGMPDHYFHSSEAAAAAWNQRASHEPESGHG
jgi:hypothetical protein